MPAYIPRYTNNGVVNNPYWYSRNPYYAIGEGLPRSECYCFGRWWENSDLNGHFQNRPRLGILDAYLWYNNVIDRYQRGQVPDLGAVACFNYNDHSVLKGAVATVEDIEYDSFFGDYVVHMISGSVMDPYQPSHYFKWWFLENDHTQGDMYPYDLEDFTFQGFIYNPITGGGQNPPRSFKPWMAKVLLNRRVNR